MRMARYGVFALVIVTALSAWIVTSFAGNWLRPKLERAVNEACRQCGIKVGTLRIALFPLRAVLGEVRYHDGNPADSEVSLLAERVEVPVPLSNLTGKSWRIGMAEIEGLKVLVTEGDARFPKPPSSDSGARTFEGAGALVRGAEFLYRHNGTGGAAEIRVHQITANVGPFGTSEALRDKAVDAHARALLERSGKVTLGVAAKLFSAAPYADVELRVDGQNLAEVNSYFLPAEGVELSGKLLTSRATVKVRDASAEGDVALEYEGLKVGFHKTRTRGGLVALLESLGAKLKVHKGNLQNSPAKREKGVVTRRHPRESVVSFILRTLKEAALRIAEA